MLVPTLNLGQETDTEGRVLWGPCGLGSFVLSVEGKDGTPTHYESLLDNLDDQYPELAGEYYDRFGWGHICPAPNDRISWAFQRSCAGFLAFQPQAMVREDARVFGVATGNKVPLQGLEGSPPYQLETANWSQSWVQKR